MWFAVRARRTLGQGESPDENDGEEFCCSVVVVLVACGGVFLLVRSLLVFRTYLIGVAMASIVAMPTVDPFLIGKRSQVEDLMGIL